MEWILIIIFSLVLASLGLSYATFTCWLVFYSFVALLKYGR